VNYIEMISSIVQYNLYYALFIMFLILNKTSFSVRACLTKKTSYKPFGASKHVLQANDENDEATHEHVDTPQEPQPQPQPWGPPPMNPLDPLMPHIMNAIQQGMQANMTSFHPSYNEQYHQLVMQHFEALNTNLGAVRNDMDSLTNQFGNPSTNMHNIQ
jgi:hypothetical protein